MLVLETGEDEHLNPLTRWGYFFPSVILMKLRVIRVNGRLCIVSGRKSTTLTMSVHARPHNRNTQGAYSHLYRNYFTEPEPRVNNRR